MEKIELSVDVTYRCLFSCLFCSSIDTLYPMDMQIDTAEKVINFIDAKNKLKNKNSVITITGGEPLIFNELSLFISEWTKNSCEVNLCTTGAIMKDENYWDRLSQAGLKSVRLSMHSVSSAKCKTIFGSKYSFDTVNSDLSPKKWTL